MPPRLSIIVKNEAELSWVNTTGSHNRIEFIAYVCPVLLDELSTEYQT